MSAARVDPASLENRTFDEIAEGETASIVHVLTPRDVELLAAVSGEMPLADREIAAGLWAPMLLGSLLRLHLPGFGTIVEEQDLSFTGSAPLGEAITVIVTAREKHGDAATILFDCTCTRQDGAIVAEGSARVRAPRTRLSRPPAAAREVVMGMRGAKLARLVEKARKLPPLATAIVHPVEPNAVAGAVEAAEAGLIVPCFIGPKARIEAAAKEAGLDLTGYKLIPTEHSHAAADMAADLAHRGEVQALLKGSLHTDEFLHPILAEENALRTDRRLSHVFVLDVPAYDRLLLVTDAAINIAPNIEAKADIVRNAIDAAHALGLAQPHVALLSAVETVNPAIASTIDAAALTVMAARGQISGGIVDGPLAFDNAVSPIAAQIKHITSPVAGKADILVAPDIDAGNMIAKQLEYLAGAQAAGIVLGARVPVILTSRADNAQSRLASCAVAALVWAARKQPAA